jgi:hypothetical protein
MQIYQLLLIENTKIKAGQIGDFLGTHNRSIQGTGWNINKIKALLKGFLESNYLRTWPKMRLYGFYLHQVYVI